METQWLAEFSDVNGCLLMLDIGRLRASAGRASGSCHGLSPCYTIVIESRVLTHGWLAVTCL